MKAINRTIKGYQDQNINYTHVFNQDQTRKLAIFLPGIGYTAKKPVIPLHGALVARTGIRYFARQLRLHESVL